MPQLKAAEDPRRDPATGRILPGNTLNPGGLSRAQRKTRRAIEKGGPSAARFLIEVVEGREEADVPTRVKAALGLLSFVVAKPGAPEPEKADGKGQSPLAGMSSAQVLALVRGEPPKAE